jgi:diguanylate cyclase (GGDEF)-like protein
VARSGGEEFVVILPDTGRNGAIAIAERLRAAIEAAPWPRRPITASFGVATLAAPATDPAALISAADGALYASKRHGRNRVTHADTLWDSGTGK